MAKIALRFFGGLLLGTVIFSIIATEQLGDGGQYIFCAIWGVGIVFGSREYMAWFAAVLRLSLKVGILAWLSFGSGLIGFMLLILVLCFIIMFGWIYGWIVLVRELFTVF